MKKYTLEDIKKLAINLVDLHGKDITRHNVVFTLQVNEFTKDLYWKDRENLVNRAWKYIRHQLLEELKIKEKKDETKKSSL